MGVTIREKPPGSGKWWIFISHHGKRRSKKVGSRARALKVAEDTRHLLAQGDLGILKQPPGAVQTFYEYAREWLDRYIAPPMRQPGTFRRYSTLLEQHIKPVIGHIPITDLTRSHCRDMLADYYKSGASKSSVELMLCVLTGALGHAVDDELIKANPAAGISRKLRLKRDKDEISPLTAAQVNKVLDQIAAAAPDLWPAFLTAFRTGLRVGELCALRWEDINFAERNISVQRTAQDQRVKG